MPNRRDVFEKPGYFWNSGMFLFRASRYLEELRAYQPEIFAACELATRNASLNSDFVCVNEEAFAACPANSVTMRLWKRPPI